jgi:CHASE2 domain-containing sensor protein
MSDNFVKKILILAANPLDTVRLSLEREVEEIRTTLQLSSNRNRFRIEPRGSVRPNELQNYMYDVKPWIVHFSGHGLGGVTSDRETGSSRKVTVISAPNSPPEGLVFEDENGRSILVSGKALSNLFASFSKEVECVVLNACYSQQQAEEIVKYIPYVVGMNQAIGDIAARKFSQGFYRAIWDDRSIEEAFASGKNAIELDGIPEELTPVLLKRSNLSLIKPPRSFKFSQQPVLVHQMLLAIATSFGVMMLIMGVRYLGLLQAWELTTFDTLMRSRPLDEQSDPRLLIVKVTEKDVRVQKQAGENLGGGSLSDRSLTKIIAKLESYQPSAIGVDIYRDAPVSAELAAKLRDSAIPIFTICKVREDGKTRGVAPPPNIPSDRMSVGFSDVPKDIDGAIRRHYLFLNPNSISSPLCQAQYGLSTLLALHYLHTKGIDFKPISESSAPNDWQGVKLGQLSFSLLPDRSEAHVGAYQKISTAGQIVLNYRAMEDPNSIAPLEKMATLLAGEIPADKIKGRIVLIGTTAQSYNDYHSTPYRTADGYVLEIPGIVLQAHMISQLISAVEDRRPLIQIWTGWMDALWIWGWAVGGGLLVIWLHHRPAYLGLATGLGIGILSGGSLMLLVYGHWVALIPAAIAIAITESIMLLVLKLRTD